MGPRVIGPSEMGQKEIGPNDFGQRKFGPKEILAQSQWAPESLAQVRWAKKRLPQMILAKGSLAQVRHWPKRVGPNSHRPKHVWPKRDPAELSTQYGYSILSTFSIKPAGLKLSVFWHYIDENSLKTPPGHKKPFTAACHADIKNHLRPHGLLKVSKSFQKNR